MKNYLKLPHDEYLNIQGILKEMRKRTQQMIIDQPKEKAWLNNKLLYIGNSLFECTHDFDSGEPYLFNDTIMTIQEIQKVLRERFPNLEIDTYRENNIKYQESIPGNVVEANDDSGLIISNGDGAWDLEIKNNEPILTWMPYPQTPIIGLNSIIQHLTE